MTLIRIAFLGKAQPTLRDKVYHSKIESVNKNWVFFDKNDYIFQLPYANHTQNTLINTIEYSEYNTQTLLVDTFSKCGLVVNIILYIIFYYWDYTFVTV